MATPLTPKAGVPVLSTDEAAEQLKTTPGIVRKLVRTRALTPLNVRDARWQFPAAQVRELNNRVKAGAMALSGLATNGTLMQFALATVVVPPAFVAFVPWNNVAWWIRVPAVCGATIIVVLGLLASVALFAEYVDDSYGLFDVPDIDWFGLARLRMLVWRPGRAAHLILLAVLLSLFLVAVGSLLFTAFALPF